MFRSTPPRYWSGESLLTGEGARLFGGRWNSPGSFAAVYASLDPETALAESLAHFRYRRISVHQAMPRVFVAIRVDIGRMIDLCSSENRASLGVTRRSLVECDWRRAQAGDEEALTQAIGRAAYLSGFEGLLVPSAALPAGRNLIVCPANLGSGSTLEVLGE